MFKKNNTFCHLLWEWAYIDECGDVFFCCLCKPGPIGNIYKHDLAYIWQKSEKAKLFRKMSLNGNLSCYSRCTVLSKKDKEIGLGRYYRNQGKPVEAEASFKKAVELELNNKSSRIGLERFYKEQGDLNQAKQLLRKTAEFSLRINYPRTVQIMAGTFCTISCVMCPQDHSSKTVLKNNILKKNIGWPRINEILMMGGEVLAIESAKELYIWLTEKMQRRIKLTTNGLLINREWAERLVKGSEWIEVSVNAATRKTHESINRGSDFERVISNLRMLIDLKRSYSIKTGIRYHFTIVPENIHEIAQAIKVADRLGCDMITYCFDSPNVETFLSKHKNIREKIKEDILKVINVNLKIKIQRNHLEQLGLVEDSNPNLVDEY